MIRSILTIANLRRSGSFARRRSPRRGKALALVAVSLPATLATLALSVDAGLLMIGRQDCRHAADSAATAAAMDLQLGRSTEDARATAIEYAVSYSGVEAENVKVSIPPVSGPNAGRFGFVEVSVEIPAKQRLLRMFASETTYSSGGRAVAGCRPATANSALTILDPRPDPVRVLGIPLIFGGLPQLIGGLEVLGLGNFNVDGAVLVNTGYGGRDENGDWVGETMLPPYAVSCTPLLPLTKFRARDLRVVGGVDELTSYVPYGDASDNFLDANRAPVPDPFAGLPAPTRASDPANVRSTNHGHVTFVGLPLGPAQTLRPGVYESLSIVSGNVRLEPGVYIVRGKNPVTQISLLIGAAKVDARGVLFYITDNAAYDVGSGLPDANDGETRPPSPSVLSLLPSVVVQGLLLGSTLSGLEDADSPFDGLLFYQRRQDRRSIILTQASLLSSGWLSGQVYAKWGHVNLVGQGNYDLAIASGTARIETVLDLTLRPQDPLPPAYDVYLAE